MSFVGSFFALRGKNRTYKRRFVTLTDGFRFEVGPGEVVLDAALRAGARIPYSCRGGTCRTCISRVLSGCVEHDPDYADDLLIDADEIADG